MSKALVWLRRDLRLHDHAALHHALRSHQEVWIAFIFDTTILDPLLKKGLGFDRRVDFLWQCAHELDQTLRSHGGGLLVRHGDPTELIPKLAEQLQVDCVFSNHDYEPSAIQRDQSVATMLAKKNIQFEHFKDQVIFEKTEVLTNSQTVFSVFTPYKNAWLKRLAPTDLEPHSCEPGTKGLIGHFAPIPKILDQGLPSLGSMGFKPTGIGSYLPPGSHGAELFLNDFLKRIDQYNIGRDFPATKGVSYLSTYLRFGNVSIRGLVRDAHRRMLAGSLGASIWLSELIWRDFYFMILANHPRIASGESFKPDYDKIEWEKGAKAQKLFKAWCDGQTGYPLVDAAMHQLNQSGYMHNRLRMVVASFLCKDLGINWRWGEQYFADQLNDFDFASNNGGWQWASSSGCDAQPYFRIFNPTTQSERFDSEGKFIRRYIPALEKLSNKSIHAPWTVGQIELQAAGITLGKDYPLPIIDHDEARKATLIRYNVVKKVS
jgi:deoxyribodipyrimidine photo-lyase